MSWRADYAALIFFSTFVTYTAALLIEKSQSLSTKKLFFLLSIIANLGILFIFKYFNFFSEAAVRLSAIFGWHISPPVLRLLLPVGISFYTFRVLSYIIDVYRGKVRATRHFGIYATYVVFFPQLLAGPIERAGNLLPQFFKQSDFDYRRVVDGLRLMVWGMFKKVVVADGLALFVNKVYAYPNGSSGLALILATIFFSFQIYADFSGYSDMAIGAGQVLGFRLMENFKAPYLARSVADFWRRWHISLSSWFQDYVFTPLYFYISKQRLVGRFSAASKHLFSFIGAVLLGDILLGLWHGAGGMFVFFGLYHGIFVVLYYLFRNQWDRMPRFIQVTLTFAITTAGWILFKANNLSDFYYIISHLFTSSNGALQDVRGLLLHQEYEFAIVAIPLLVLIVSHAIEAKPGGISEFLNRKSFLFRWFSYWAIIMMIFVFGTFGSKEFIYFNF